LILFFSSSCQIGPTVCIIHFECKRYLSVIFASPVRQPFKALHFSAIRSSALWVAPSIHPPTRSVGFAVFTIAFTPSLTIPLELPLFYLIRAYPALSLYFLISLPVYFFLGVLYDLFCFLRFFRFTSSFCLLQEKVSLSLSGLWLYISKQSYSIKHRYTVNLGLGFWFPDGDFLSVMEILKNLMRLKLVRKQF